MLVQLIAYKWKIKEIRGVANQNFSLETIVFVEDWLSAHNNCMLEIRNLQRGLKERSDINKPAKDIGGN